MFGRRQLFIYYRFAAEHRAALVDAVQQAQCVLCELQPGLVARLMLRADDTGPALTAMEVYAMHAGAAAEGIDAAQQRLIEARLCAALRPWVPPEQRHHELFDDLTPPLPCAS